MMYICGLIDNYIYKTIINMAKKRIKLTEQDLHEVVKEATMKVLNKGVLLTEMARINTKETGKGIFPFNSYDVRIWSNDHEPPHLHVICEGWNISFLIENGELLEVKTKGEKEQVYNDICKKVKKWLSSPCAVLPIVTNMQNAYAVWIQLHSN